MIQILKQTPITFNGVDGWEVLIKDDEIRFDDEWICERCMYRDWEKQIGYTAPFTPCSIIHGCRDSYQTYFEFRTEPVKQNDAP